MFKLLTIFMMLQVGNTVTWTSELKQTESGNQVVITGELKDGVDHITGTIDYITCEGVQCNMPEDMEFDLILDGTSGIVESSTEDATVLQSLAAPVAKVQPVATHPATQEESNGSLWGLILEAILWGFAMLLTPCVFPMVPMTISFFIKGSANPAQGRFKAIMYGIFIILLYTVPISLIIGITWILGGSGVTADIFNWLSTHWLPNIIFFLVFMIFAASFFGAFEITLPSKWTNSADKNSDKKGLGGVFFLALTLVLVSFSCTGPIVGTVLIKSTQGEFWAPMVTMLAFSIAFALPFTVFALFPSLLKKLPKSGGWLNSVKVVLGFIELALGLKFLSTADQTYHWGILNREVYLAIWIVIFILLGLYLLGKIRFKHDDPMEYVPVKRLFLAIASFTFAMYLIPGLWGAPLSGLSGYLPPMESQAFVLGANTTTQPSQDEANLEDGTVIIAHGLKAYDNLEDGYAAAKVSGKRVFVDITGHGCVNCREMEARVWSDPAVLEMLRNDFEIVALYVDDKTKIPEDQQPVNAQGKKLKDVGRVNSDIALTQFGVNSQPNYFILDAEGNILKGPRAYDLDIQEYIKFLSK